MIGIISAGAWRNHFPIVKILMLEYENFLFFHFLVLQMEERSWKFLVGILEDVLVKVQHIYIPINFIVMDIRKGPHVPIIMGRPFLYTVCTIIYVKRRTLSIEVSTERLDFIITTMLEDPYTEVSCYLIEVAK